MSWMRDSYQVLCIALLQRRYNINLFTHTTLTCQVFIDPDIVLMSLKSATRVTIIVRLPNLLWAMYDTDNQPLILKSVTALPAFKFLI